MALAFAVGRRSKRTQLRIEAVVREQGAGANKARARTRRGRERGANKGREQGANERTYGRELVVSVSASVPVKLFLPVNLGTGSGHP